MQLTVPLAVLCLVGLTVAQHPPCAYKCPANEVPQDYAPCCEPTCYNDCSKMVCDKRAVYGPTCVCKPGFVRHQGCCIPKCYCPAPCGDHYPMPYPPYFQNEYRYPFNGHPYGCACCNPIPPPCKTTPPPCTTTTEAPTTTTVETTVTTVEMTTEVETTTTEMPPTTTEMVTEAPTTTTTPCPTTPPPKPCTACECLILQQPCCEPTCDNDCSGVSCPLILVQEPTPTCACRPGLVRYQGHCIERSACPQSVSRYRLYQAQPINCACKF